MTQNTTHVKEEPLFYEVVDCYNTSYHTGYGVMARVETLPEAEALKSAMDGKWDGCEGDYRLKIVPIFKSSFGLQEFKNRLCKHDWRKTTTTPWGKEVTLVKGLFECSKCQQRRRVMKNLCKLPAYDGIAYLDENGKLVFPKKKEWLKVPRSELE